MGASAGSVGAALLGLSPDQRETLQALVLGADTSVTRPGLLRRLFTSFTSKQMGFVVLSAVAAWFAARRCLRSRSALAQAFVRGTCNQVVKPLVRWPAVLLGAPGAAEHMVDLVDRFLDNNNRAREVAERGFNQSLPLLLAAWSLHRRLKQILDSGHAFREREAATKQHNSATANTLDLTNRHFRAQCEVLFLLAEYCAWVEEIRRHAYTLGTAGHYELENGIRAVETAFEAELQSETSLDSDGEDDEALVQDIEADEARPDDAAAGHGTRWWVHMRALWLKWCFQCAMLFSAARGAAILPASLDGGKARLQSREKRRQRQVSSATRGSTPRGYVRLIAHAHSFGGKMPRIYSSHENARRCSVLRNRTAGFAESAVQFSTLLPGEEIFVQPRLVHGTVKIQKWEQEGSGPCDELHLVTYWISSSREEQPRRRRHIPGGGAGLLPATNARFPEPSSSRFSCSPTSTQTASALNSSVASRDTDTARSVVGQALKKQEEEGRQKSLDSIWIVSSDEDGAKDESRDDGETARQMETPVQLRSSEQQMDTSVNEAVFSTNADTTDNGGAPCDFQLGMLQTRLLGEVMLRHLSAPARFSLCPGTSVDRLCWAGHSQHNILSFAEFAKLTWMVACEKVGADAMASLGSPDKTDVVKASELAVALGELPRQYDEMSTFDPAMYCTTAGEDGLDTATFSGAVRQPAKVMPTSLRRLRRVEEALLFLITSVDEAGLVFPEAKKLRAEFETRKKIQATTSLLSRLFGGADPADEREDMKAKPDPAEASS